MSIGIARSVAEVEAQNLGTTSGGECGCEDNRKYAMADNLGIITHWLHSRVGVRNSVKESLVLEVPDKQICEDTPN